DDDTVELHRREDGALTDRAADLRQVVACDELRVLVAELSSRAEILLPDVARREHDPADTEPQLRRAVAQRTDMGKVVRRGGPTSDRDAQDRWAGRPLCRGQGQTADQIGRGRDLDPRVKIGLDPGRAFGIPRADEADARAAEEPGQATDGVWRRLSPRGH